MNTQVTKALQVDDFIEMRTHNEGEIYAAWLLLFFRLPAVMKLKFRSLLAPCKLFCTWQNERWEVVGASRLGDVCVTHCNFNNERWWLRPACRSE